MTPSPSAHARWLRVAKELAADADQMVQRSTGPAAFTTKASSSDLVTEFDRNVESMVRSRLADEFPGHGVLGEEGGRSGPADAPTWVVDPIDGTTNFAHGVPWSSFSLAVTDAHGPAVGVVRDFGRGTVVSAQRGEGAWVDEQPASVTSATSVASQVVFTEWAGNSAWPGLIDLLATVAAAGGTTRILGSSALSLAHVAAGHAAAVVLGAYQPWDVLAGVLAAREAGAVVIPRIDAGGAAPAGGLLVAAPGVADQMLGLLRQSTEWAA